jgi:hypothetical protein
MKSYTFSCDEATIRKARAQALLHNERLNFAFQQWLEELAPQSTREERYRRLMHRLRHVTAGGPYTREELNERR